MPFAPPVATVVVPVKNAARDLPQQLAALDAQVDPPRFEVIVADNGSTDDLAGAVAAARGGLDLRVLDASRKPGPSHARNAAAAAARGTYLLFCDADDVVGPDWVRAFVEAQGEAEARGASEGALLGGSMAHGRLNSPAQREAYGETRDDPRPPAERPVLAEGTGHYGPYQHVPSSNLCVPRAVFLRVGGFDESWEGAGEDTDFAWRVQLAGVPAHVAPRAVVEYRLRTTAPQIFAQARAWARERVLLFERFAGTGVEPGGSIKHSARHAPSALLALVRAPRGSARRLRAAQELGDDLGFLEGSLKYRVLKRAPRRSLADERP